MPLSTKEIKRAQWYWSHRQQFYYLLVAILFIADLVIGGFYIVKYNNYKESDSLDEISASLVETKIDYLYFHDLFGPQPLSISREAIISQKETYNFLALVENPNLNWQVKEIKYHFEYSANGKNQKTETKSTFILPQSEKYLYFIDSTPQERLSNFKTELIIDDISWQRIRKEEDFALISENPLSSLKFSQVNLQRTAEDNQKVSQLSFQLENPTVYSFWEVPLVIVPYQGNQPVSLGLLPVRYLESQEKRELKYLWPYFLPSITEVDIRPDLNILDSNIFIPVQ